MGVSRGFNFERHVMGLSTHTLMERSPNDRKCFLNDKMSLNKPFSFNAVTCAVAGGVVIDLEEAEGVTGTFPPEVSVVRARVSTESIRTGCSGLKTPAWN